MGFYYQKDFIEKDGLGSASNDEGVYMEQVFLVREIVLIKLQGQECFRHVWWMVKR